MTTNPLFESNENIVEMKDFGVSDDILSNKTSSLNTDTTFEQKKAIINQVKPPLEKFYSNSFSPFLILSYGKVVKYQITKMAIWRSLIMYYCDFIIYFNLLLL